MTRKIGCWRSSTFVLSCAVVAQTAPAASDWKARTALGRRQLQVMSYKFDFHAATKGDCGWCVAETHIGA
jgi:hypothetical protein